MFSQHGTSRLITYIDLGRFTAQYGYFTRKHACTPHLIIVYPPVARTLRTYGLRTTRHSEAALPYSLRFLERSYSSSVVVARCRLSARKAKSQSLPSPHILNALTVDCCKRLFYGEFRARGFASARDRATRLSRLARASAQSLGANFEFDGANGAERPPALSAASR